MSRSLDVLSESDLRGARGACSESPLRLRRAWPRSPGHLLLEYVNDRGRIFPGQWMSDRSELARVAEQTARRCPQVPPVLLEVRGQAVLLQPGGADRRLVDLDALVARPDATLLSHRPERRAVVRLGQVGGGAFAKVMRPSRLPRVLARARAVQALAGHRFAVPDMLEVDRRRGMITWAPLAGRSLDELLRNDQESLAAARAAGGALRGLHDVAPPTTWSIHDASAEQAVLEKWLHRLEAYDPVLHAQLSEVQPRVLDGLAHGSSPPGMIHADFHEQQVFVDAGGRVALLDLDTVTRGEPALDVGNFLAHLELRALQGRFAPADAARASDTFLEGYVPGRELLERLPAYRDASRLRLACVHAFRPRWRSVSRALACRLARQVPAAAPLPGGNR